MKSYMYCYILICLLLFSFFRINAQQFFNYTIHDSVGNDIQYSHNIYFDTTTRIITDSYLDKFFVRKFDVFGNYLWMKRFYCHSDSLASYCSTSGHSNFGVKKCLFDKQDSSIYLIGSIFANYNFCVESYTAVLKLDANCDTVWTIHLGPASPFRTGLILSDSVLIASEGALSNINSLTGTFNWFGKMTAPGTFSSTAMALLKESDTSFFFCGTYNPSVGWRRGLFGKASASGNVIWTKTYGINFQAPWFSKMCKDVYNKFYILDYVFDSLNNYNCKVVCMNDTGLILWNKHLYIPGITLTPVDITETSNGGCMLVANYSIIGQPIQFPVIIGLDTAGIVTVSKKLYNKITGTPGLAYSINHLSTTQFVVDGTKLVTFDTNGLGCSTQNIVVFDSSYIYTETDVPLQFYPVTPNINRVNEFYEIPIYTDSIFTDSCAYYLGIYGEHQNSLISIYPNPVKDILYISTNIKLSSNLLFSIIDMQGRVIKEDKIFKIDSSNIQIDVRTLSLGIYLIKLNGRVQRFVKM